jgi:hypothetical protein
MASSSRTWWRKWGTVSSLLLGTLFSATFTVADEAKSKAEKNPEKAATAKSEVGDSLREAINNELIGDEKARDEQLDALIKAHPELDTPHWLRGFMKTADGWRQDDLVEREISPAETTYRELRDKATDNMEGNRKLARYCRKNKLTDIAGGHWRRILDFNPDDAEARKALGHIRFEGVWTTKAEIDRAGDARKKFSASVVEWSKKIPGWVASWRGDNPRNKEKEKARESLLAIRDAAAVPVLYSSLAYRSEPETEFLLEILSGIPDIESTRIIAEIGVTKQSPQILEMCADELRNRDEQSYVPQLLIGLSGPITSEVKLDIVPYTRQVLYRHTFVREGQYEQQMQTFAAAHGQYWNNYHRNDHYYGMLWIDPQMDVKNRERAAVDLARIQPQVEKNNADQNAKADSIFMENAAMSMAQMMWRERQRVLQNMSIEETNNRISLLLAKIFDENNGTPEQWWKWWNNRHEQQDSRQKPLTQLVQYLVNVDVYNSQSYSQSFGSALHPSCFVAGTPVVTSQGMRPIESLKTGDVVLSQSIDTGELTWKPVICPTIRPQTDVLKLTVGDESYVCTLKHPFWKVGHGWIWAKELVEGDLIRTSSGTLPISAIEPQGKAQVHNLVVADFNTYFVGKNRLLTHDTTLRVPTLAIAPGVFAKED